MAKESRRHFLKTAAVAVGASALAAAGLEPPEAAAAALPSWEIKLHQRPTKMSYVAVDRGPQVLAVQIDDRLRLYDPSNPDVEVAEFPGTVNFAAAARPGEPIEYLLLMSGEGTYNLVRMAGDNLSTEWVCGMDGWRTSLSLLQGQAPDGQPYTGQASTRQIYDGQGQPVPRLFYHYIGHFTDALSQPARGATLSSRLNQAKAAVESFNSVEDLRKAFTDHLSPTTKALLQSQSQGPIDLKELIAADLAVYYPQTTIRSQLDMITNAFQQTAAQGLKNNNHYPLSPAQLSANVIAAFDNYGVELREGERVKIQDGSLTGDETAELAWRFAAATTDLDALAGFSDIPLVALGQASVGDDGLPLDGDLKAVAAGDYLHIFARNNDGTLLYLTGKYVRDQWGGSFEFTALPTSVPPTDDVAVGAYSIMKDDKYSNLIHVTYVVGGDIYYSSINAELLPSGDPRSFQDRFIPNVAGAIADQSLDAAIINGYPVVAAGAGDKILAYGPSGSRGGFSLVPVVTQCEDPVARLQIFHDGQRITGVVGMPTAQGGETIKAIPINTPLFPQAWLPFVFNR